MNLQESQIRDCLGLLSNTVDKFISFFKEDKDFNRMVYTYWTAKDILGHVAFWHESFARNLSDVAEKRKANPLKGKLSDVNKMSVDTARDVTINDLCQRLAEAQRIIESYILKPNIDKIPYKKGSRDYSPLEHLQVVNSHINKHLKDIRDKLR